MILCVFLAIGETWKEFIARGQAQLLLKQNFTLYSRYFTRVYVFSYGNENDLLMPKVKLVPNIYNLHRYIYALLLPLLHYKLILQADVIRGMQLSGGIPAVISKILFNKPTVINYGYDYVYFSKLEKKWLQAAGYFVLERIILQFIDNIIVTTRTLFNKISRLTKTSVLIFPNSIDTNLFRPKRVIKLYDIIYIGRLEKQKNLTLLLSAAAGVKQASKLKLLFIGMGKEKPHLIKLSQSLRLNLRIINKVKHDLLPLIINRARIFVLPSHIEGHPKALLEAMSCGLASIGTNVEGIRDIIKHKYNGLLVEMDTHELSKGIEEALYNSSLQKKIRHNARLTVLKEYNSSKIWVKEAALLKKLARK